MSEYIHIDDSYPPSESFSSRYEKIESANADSFYLQDINRPFDTYLSVHSVGQDRTEYGKAALRHIMDGNMSDIKGIGPTEINGRALSDEDRARNAHTNMALFLNSIEVDQTKVRILFPQNDYSKPLTGVNVDDHAIELSKLTVRSDFIYSYDPNLVLAVRPADCPIMVATADTTNGTIHMLVHYPWKGLVANYIDETDSEFNRLGVNRDSLNIYLSPGAHAENYPYINYPHNPLEKYPNFKGLFTNITQQKDGLWRFTIDTPWYVYNQVFSLGVQPNQVYCDTSDTAALNSGYSSNGRAARLGEDNRRDLFVAKFKM